MVRFTRYTDASNVPIPISAVTDRGQFQFELIDVFSTIDIPGCKLLDLRIPTADMYSVKVIHGCEESRYEDCHEWKCRKVDSVVVTDGFRYLNGTECTRCVRRPLYARCNGHVNESGFSILE